MPIPWREIPMPMRYEGTIRRWLVDTGACRHVVGWRHPTKQQLASMVKSDPTSLGTANGLIEVDDIVELMVDELGFTVWACVLPEPACAKRGATVQD